MQDNTEKITPDLIRHRQLVFYPKTGHEAVLIQQKLLELGALWAGGEAAVRRVPETVNGGILVKQGKMYINPGIDADYRIARISQFEADYLSADQRFLKEQFDRVHARLDAMDRKIVELQEAILPKDIGKPGLRKPGA